MRNQDQDELDKALFFIDDSSTYRGRRCRGVLLGRKLLGGR